LLRDFLREPGWGLLGDLVGYLQNDLLRDLLRIPGDLLRETGGSDGTSSEDLLNTGDQMGDITRELLRYDF
jgi:hypothetical protein